MDSDDGPRRGETGSGGEWLTRAGGCGSPGHGGGSELPTRRNGVTARLPRLLLAHAAQELQGYGLTLWRWQVDNPDLCVGFISREEDEAAVRRCAAVLDAVIVAVRDEEVADEW